MGEGGEGPVIDILYVYAGFSASSQNVMLCDGQDGCGALVIEGRQQQHAEWHASLLTRLQHCHQEVNVTTEQPAEGTVP
jgi:alpha-D-ribose 1-methylphosphonate 5-triphosphate synthase subunit PhnG